MNSRRKFLQKSTVAAMGTIALPYCTPTKKENVKNAPKKAIGIQLYTVRAQMAKDPAGTLKLIGDMGYRQIETAGYQEGTFYGMSPNDFKKLSDDAGLDIVSSHVSIDSLYANPEQAIEACVATDQQYIVLPWLNEAQRASIDQYKQHIELMNKVGELCSQANLTFCYHNHDFEFWAIDGQVPMDLILSETNAELVKMELDLYWITKVGKDPIQFFRDNPGRCPLWHVKDMNATDQNFTEVGSGVIDFKSIFAAAETAGMKHFFVEQDQSNDAMKSIKTSFDYVSQNL